MDISRHVMEAKSALELSEKLSGHALALSHMAGLITKRSWSIQRFLAAYEKNMKKIHSTRGKDSLDAIFHLSFEELDPCAASILGVLSYISPDKIPQELFESDDISQLPEDLSFCIDEFDFLGTLEPLLTLALVKRDKETRELSLHRLVQTQYRYYMRPEERQKVFDNAVKLLHRAFPHVNSKAGQLYDRWTICQASLQHILALKDNFKKEQGESDAPKPTLLFCELLHNCSR